MTANATSETNGNSTNPYIRQERIALLIVLLIVIGLPAATLGYQFGLRPRLASDVQEIQIVGRIPEQGGWSVDLIQVQVGKPVRLILTSDDVVHGFAIGKLGVDAGWVYPGQPKVIEFTPQRPGRYTFYCTTWCADGHWRMRGTLEVYDPADPAAVDIPVDPPQTDWQAAGLDLDAPHPAAVYPQTRPIAARGAAIWQGIPGLPDPATVLAQLDLRRQSPAQVFEALRDDQVPGVSLAALRDLPPEALWDVVAYLWREHTTAERLELGRRLYLPNCAPCHGEMGNGQGPAAASLQAASSALGQMDGHQARPPTDFTNAQAMAGGTGLLYYGKMVRGGMGTGMPYWGDIFTEQELWALVDYLWSFFFDFSDPPLTDN